MRLSRHGMGWRKSDRTASPAQHLIEHQRARVGAVPLARPTLNEYRGERTDQGSVGACWAFATARAVQLGVASSGGAPDAQISKRAAYYVGRAEEYAGQDPASRPQLQDTGTDPIVGLEGLRKVGVTPERLCPWVDSVEVNNEQPPLDVFVSAYDFRGLAWAQVFEAGTARVNKVADALSHRIPVIFGTMVDRNFEANAGARISRIEPTRILGGHMLAALAVLDDQLIAELNLIGARSGDVLFDNWWTTEWGYKGLGVMGAEFFGSEFVDDVLLVSSPPLGFGKAQG